MSRARTTSTIVDIPTAAGDIYTASAANTPARLGIGSTGQVMTVAGGVPTWATPATPSPSLANYSLLNSGGTSPTSGSSVTITGLSGNNSLVIIWASLAATGSASLRLQFNSDTGANYNYMGINFINTSTSSGYFGNNGTIGATYIPTMFGSSSMYGGVTVLGANTAGVKPVNVTGGSSASSSANMSQTQGWYAGTSVISSVTLSLSANTFSAGTIYVYGSAA